MKYYIVLIKLNNSQDLDCFDTLKDALKCLVSYKRAYGVDSKIDIILKK